jgi:hypothetical protein
MIQENEVIMLTLGLGVLIYMFMDRLNLKRIPSFKILTITFCALVTSWILTVLEGFFLQKYLNFLEHMCYAISAILLAFWLWRVLGRSKE